MGNTISVPRGKFTRKSRKEVGPERLDIAMSVELVRVGVHGDDVGVIGLEGPKNRVLQDGLMQNLGIFTLLDLN